jgi:steroid 5-alpha reductase family enzyme
MSGLTVYGIGFLVILGCMTVLWLISLCLKNSSIVDIFWGTGFVVANGVYFALTPDGFLPRKLLIGILVTVWGLRLSIHILTRNWGKGEDFRYRKWREENGPRWWWWSFFQVFLLQGVLLWIVSAPLLAANFSALPDRLTVIDAIAVLFWAIGFFFESSGDAQLARFKADTANKGKVLDTGVWRYSRHPNYFGDAAQWWGFYLIGACAGGWWTIFSPAIMTLLLLRVSGVALLEKTLETRPGYKEYAERTNAFIPGPPKNRGHRR